MAGGWLCLSLIYVLPILQFCASFSQQPVRQGRLKEENTWSMPTQGVSWLGGDLTLDLSGPSNN